MLPKNTQPYKALFLDRDGVINHDHGYVHTPEQFSFMPGIFELLEAAVNAGYRPIVITNQSGINRGYYTQSDFERLTRWMLARLFERGLTVGGVYYCPHRPDEQCHCRKPEAGLFEQAIIDHQIDPAASIMIGDKISDLKAAQKVGTKKRILLTGGENLSDEAITHTAKTLLDIIALI
jgi:D-glycero-D-manno-heptose 1,7-bisphosphate phosphatase